MALLSDHGHILENGTRIQANGEGERWRSASDPPGEGELQVSGSRIKVDDSKELIAPWTEKLRYGAKKNGYHGGLTPQEMVVPMALLTAGDVKLTGWVERASYLPSWWERHEEESVEQKQKVRSLPKPKKKVLSKRQIPLFDIEPISSGKAGEISPELETGSSLIEKLIASDTYSAQKNIVGRGLPKDEMIHHFVSTLVGHGGKMTCAALSRELDVPEFRLRGLIASVQRVLNFEGYAILSRDDPSQTVVLNLDLLKRQFELPE